MTQMPNEVKGDDNGRLRRELAARAIRTMGPHSPYWNCTICGAAHLTPLAFEHKPGCLLVDERPRNIVPEDGPPYFYTIQVQHAIMREALEAIAELNHGTTGQAAKAALETIDKKEAPALRPQREDAGAGGGVVSGRHFWLHYEYHAGKWVVSLSPPKVTPPDAEIIHAVEVLAAPSAPEELREALTWALDEVDALSNWLCGFAYPQGMGMLGRRSAVNEDSYVNAVKVRAALSSPSPPTGQDATEEGWQPIETAPKDGREILCGDFSGAMGDDFQQVVSWEERTYDDDSSSEGWAICDGPMRPPSVFTHWRPLPAAPKPETAQKGGKS